ncbi:MAG: protein translocase subunit SecF [Candidatus Aenigmatarchaeota archaeon]
MKFDHKMLLVIPVAVFLISAAIFVSQYAQTGELLKRSIDMKGGLVITINTEERLDTAAIELGLKQNFSPVNVREVRSFRGYGTVIETSADMKSDDIIAAVKAMGFDASNTDVESIGPSLGASFWNQAQIAILGAFILMSIVVFIIFRSVVPSAAVILSAFCDIFMTLAFMQLFGIELSLAGLAAILMLIGYSVDTDIMLTSRLLKESDDKTLNDKLRHALKTGLTMTLTSIGALMPLLVLGISPVITQIATVLMIGLAFDIMNTWLTNYAILKWYCEKKGMV